MPSTVPQKLRQTCDPCRKAKVKCNKQMPACSRCLAAGINEQCTYGVSNRGGRWKNGVKMGSQSRTSPPTGLYMEHGSTLSLPQTPPSDCTTSSDGFYLTEANFSGSFHESPSLYPNPGVHYSGSDTPMNDWHQSLETNWTVDTFNPDTGCSSTHYSLPPTPTTLSHPSHRSSLSLNSMHSAWSTPTLEDHGDPLHPSGRQVSQVTTPPLECRTMARHGTGSCTLAAIKLLSSLHQSFPLIPETAIQVNLSNLNHAVVLTVNEDAANCCTELLQCPTCQHDDHSDSFTILSSLLRRVISLNETFVTSPHAQCDLSSIPLMEGVVMDQASERGLKAEVCLIGIKKLEDAIAKLKRAAATNMMPDYERLTCSSLIVSLQNKMKTVTEAFRRMCDTSFA